MPRLKDISCSRFELPLDVSAEAIRAGDRLDSLSAQDLKAFSSGPLRVLQLADYVALRSRADRGLGEVAHNMPFDLSAHPIARTYNGASVLGRVAEDVAHYARQQNEGQEAELLNFLDPDVAGYVAEGVGSEGFAEARAQLAKLGELLANLLAADLAKTASLISEVLRAVNTVSAVPAGSSASASTSASASATASESPRAGGGAGGAMASLGAALESVLGSAAPASSPALSAAPSLSGMDDGVARARLSYSLARYGGLEGTLSFDFLVGLLLSPHPQFELQQLNPLLSSSVAQAVLRAVVQVLFLANRVGQVRRCRAQLRQLQASNEALLAHMASGSSSTAASLTPFIRDVVLTAEKLAGLLVARRYFMEVVKVEPASGSGSGAGAGPASTLALVFDPRFLVFEFTYNLLLRKSQVELVQGIVQSGTGSSRPSVCHQMIMGAGKTTVVAPLLGLMLADGKRLVAQVVPQALLDFSRSVTRERFSAVIKKAIFQFSFDRFCTVDEALHRKLLKAIESKSILVCTSTSIKAFQLKFIELLNQLEEKKITLDIALQTAKKKEARALQEAHAVSSSWSCRCASCVCSGRARCCWTRWT